MSILRFVCKPFLFSFCRKSIAAAIQGIRQTALLQEKSSYPLSVGGAVAVIQHLFNVGFTVEDFTAQLDIGDTPFIAVVLKCPAAHLQPCRHLLVSEETLTAQCRAVIGGQVLYIINSRSRLPIKWIIHLLSLLINSFILLWI